jgi:hypothetical protein
MPIPLRRLLPLLPVIALAACGAAPTSTTGENAAPADVQVAALSRVNAFRQAANLPIVQLVQALDVSAVKHAGYQAIRYTIDPSVLLTHYETAPPPAGVDPPDPNGVPDTSNPLFTGVNLTPRFRAANGGNDLYPPGLYIYSEDISSVSGGDASVKSLWNTVYHRLPMCRHSTLVYGYGDAETARLQYAEKNVPNVAGWGTHDFAGRQDVTITGSCWPENNGHFIVPSFDTDTEHPDPLDGSNIHQTPTPAPAAGVVGNPLHFIAPTSLPWTAVTVTLNEAATPGTQLPVYVIAGFPQGSPPPLASGVTAWDDQLEAGEIFVLPQSPLDYGVTYQYSISGTAGAPFTTGTVTFTTL